MVAFSKSPWIAIMTTPRKTIREVVAHSPYYCLWPLSAIVGFPFLLGAAQAFAWGTSLSLLSIIVFSALLSPFVGYILLSFSSGFFCLTGKWLGGSGGFLAIRAALAWSHVPFIATISSWILLLFLFKGALFLDTPIVWEGYGIISGLVAFLSLIQFIAGVWSFVLTIKTLSEVQGFSVFRSIINLVLAIFIMGIVISLVYWSFQYCCSPFFDAPLYTEV